MLTELNIENLAVIAEAQLSFDQRLNVFTGETGAGKSILIHGINAVLGQRVTKDIVRTGCDKAVVTALFTRLGDTSKRVLESIGADYEEDAVTLTREIFADGGSVARLNGKVTTVSVLRELGETLITIHGQHDNQILLSPERHLQVLDDFGGDDSALRAYQQDFKALQNLAREIGTLKRAEQENRQRMDLLQAQVDEIGALKLQRDEEEQIEAAYQLALNSTQIAEGIQSAQLLLDGEDAAVDLLRDAENRLLMLTDLFPQITSFAERLTAARIELSDLADGLSQSLDSVDVDAETFAALSDRHDALERCKRRYQRDGNGLLDLYEESLAALSYITGAEEEIARLESEKSQLLQKVTERAKALSAYRAAAAERFVARVTEELAFLDMPQVELAVQFTPGKLTIHGMETAEFLISANPGEPPKPIAKIASGGELSRIMLALKSVIADRDEIPTMIFDEIDTGVSGRAAQKIGVKLREIGGVRQVLCITHLAQIAVMADHHILIEKRNIDGRTATQVQVIRDTERVAEIARIMGGANPSALMLENAKEELERAQMTARKTEK